MTFDILHMQSWATRHFLRVTTSQGDNQQDYPSSRVHCKCCWPLSCIRMRDGEIDPARLRCQQPFADDAVPWKKLSVPSFLSMHSTLQKKLPSPGKSVD